MSVYTDSLLSSAGFTKWATRGTWGDIFVVPPSGPATSFTPAASVSVATGVNPLETSYSLYGHTVPLSVFGVGRIGGEIISGPWVENGFASFIISFGMPADPSGTRDLREIAFDSEVVWDSVNGFSNEGFTHRFYGGSLTQAADALEIAHFGADAVAYRPQMLLVFENLPLANTKFGKIPYVAAVIGDASGDDVNLGEAFERIAYSPWVGWTSAQFATSGVTDGLVSGGLIFAQDADFLSTIQQFGRFYPSWDILQTDKLRIVDRGATVTADIVLDKTRLMDSITVSRQGADSIKKDLELSTIDPDADYTIVPSIAHRPREPIAVTTSVGKDSAYLPVIMDSSTRTAIVTFAKYHEEATRKTISGTAMAYGLEIEPGALVRISNLGDDFNNETFKVMETLHGANYVVEFTAASILRCLIGEDPEYAGAVLLMGFEGADGSTNGSGMTDESSRVHGLATIANDAQIDTAQFKFGSSSLKLDGSSDYISFEDHIDWHLSAANADQFTVECWALFNAITAPSNLLVGHVFSTASQSWDFGTSGTGGEFRFRSSADGTTFNVNVTSSGAGLITGIWYHLAVDKDSSGKIRIYKDGVMVGSDTPADSRMFGSPQPLHIGCLPGANGMNGWIDELRITKGIARYASDSGFTPPSSAFPR